MGIAKDSNAALFKKLEGLQPCEVSSLKAGTHIFAVYGTFSSLLWMLWEMVKVFNMFFSPLDTSEQGITSSRVPAIPLKLYVHKILKMQKRNWKELRLKCYGSIMHYMTLRWNINRYTSFHVFKSIRSFHFVIQCFGHFIYSGAHFNASGSGSFWCCDNKIGTRETRSMCLLWYLGRNFGTV